MVYELFFQTVVDTAGHQGVRQVLHTQAVVPVVLYQSEHRQNRLTCETRWCDTRQDDRDLLTLLEQLQYENQRPTTLALPACTPHLERGSARSHVGLHGVSGLRWWCTTMTSRLIAQVDGINPQRLFRLLLSVLRTTQ